MTSDRRSLRAPQVDLQKAVNAQRLRQLAAVVGVVAEEAEKDCLAGVDLRPLARLPLERLEQRIRRPSFETGGDDPPGGLEPLDQLPRAPRRIEIVLPTDPARRVRERS